MFTLLVFVCAAAALAWYGNRVYRSLARDAIWWEHVQRTTNPEDVRKWAMAILSDTNNFTDWHPNEWIAQMPQSLLQEYEDYKRPPMIKISGSPEYEPNLQLIFGGGLYHWGLVIGQTNLSQPNYPRVQAWVPGVYFVQF